MVCGRLPARREHHLLLAGLFAASLSLRPQIVGVGPLLPSIQQGLGVSHSVAGLLPTIVVLCMGLFAPASVRFARRVGARAAITTALVLIGVFGVARACALSGGRGDRADGAGGNRGGGRRIVDADSSERGVAATAGVRDRHLRDRNEPRRGRRGSAAVPLADLAWGSGVVGAAIRVHRRLADRMARLHRPPAAARARARRSTGVSVAEPNRRRLVAVFTLTSIAYYGLTAGLRPPTSPRAGATERRRADHRHQCRHLARQSPRRHDRRLLRFPPRLPHHRCRPADLDRDRRRALSRRRLALGRPDRRLGRHHLPLFDDASPRRRGQHLLVGAMAATMLASARSSPRSIIPVRRRP